MYWEQRNLPEKLGPTLSDTIESVESQFITFLCTIHFHTSPSIISRTPEYWASSDVQTVSIIFPIPDINENDANISPLSNSIFLIDTLHPVFKKFLSDVIGKEKGIKKITKINSIRYLKKREEQITLSKQMKGSYQDKAETSEIQNKHRRKSTRISFWKLK